MKLKYLFVFSLISTVQKVASSENLSIFYIYKTINYRSFRYKITFKSNFSLATFSIYTVFLRDNSSQNLFKIMESSNLKPKLSFQSKRLKKYHALKQLHELKNISLKKMNFCLSEYSKVRFHKQS